MPATVNSIVISGPTQVNENSSANYTARAYYSDGSNQDVTGPASWSENSAYASINSSGTLTTSSVSSDQLCTITASYGGKSDTHGVTIKNITATVTSIVISGSTQVNENSSANYTCRAYYDDGSNQDVTSSASWSENSAYISINSSGTLITSSVSSDQPCTITASYGGKSDTHGVTIKNIGGGITPQPIPYTQNFSSGKPGASGGWEYYSTNGGRIQVLNGRLQMDDNDDNSSDYALNEAVLHLNLAGMSGVILTLDHINSSPGGDEPTPLSASFSGHYNGDGIAFSADGVTWYKLTDLIFDFTAQSFDLDAAVQAAGISYTSDFRIKFQQYDNYSWGTDGRAFDNIVVKTPAWQIVGIGDFDTDNKVDDILWRNTATGGVGTWLMDGTTENNVHIGWRA